MDLWTNFRFLTFSMSDYVLEVKWLGFANFYPKISINHWYMGFLCSNEPAINKFKGKTQYKIWIPWLVGFEYKFPWSRFIRKYLYDQFHYVCLFLWIWKDLNTEVSVTLVSYRKLIYPAYHRKSFNRHNYFNSIRDQESYK